MKTKEFIELGQQMLRSFQIGKTEEAKQLAFTYLKIAESKKENWNYGNAIHQANIILGKIALQEGLTEEAKEYLKAAGSTPGSPQLNSFGPNMSLAKALIELGETEAAIEFIDSSKQYWKWIFSWRKTRKWKKEIGNGVIPQFGANLNY